MILQGLFFVAAAALMGAAGISILVPPLRSREFDRVYTRMLVAFAVKLVLGVGLLVLALKVFGWSATVSAFGMVAAYLVALGVLTFVVMRTVREGQER